MATGGLFPRPYFAQRYFPQKYFQGRSVTSTPVGRTQTASWVTRATASVGLTRTTSWNVRVAVGIGPLPGVAAYGTAGDQPPAGQPTGFLLSLTSAGPIAVAPAGEPAGLLLLVTSAGVLTTGQAYWFDRVSVGLTRLASWLTGGTHADVPPPTPTVVSPDATTNPFGRVYVDFLVPGNSRVHWELRPQLRPKNPLTFQLQVGQTGNPLADDWTNVGPPLVNAFVAYDPSGEALGKQLTAHYRVLLTDGDGVTYSSPPANVLGQLSVREWLWARDILRREKLRLNKWAGVKGHILKRKRAGVPCPVCLDPYTGSVTNSKCQVCKGTRYVSGYFAGLAGQFVDLGNTAVSEKVNPAGPKGTEADMAVSGRFLGEPLLATFDVWVDDQSGLRYWVDAVQVEARLRGVPLVLTVNLKQFAFDHVIYNVPLEGN